MDADGYFNFSAANIWHRAVIERARMVIVEVTRHCPTSSATRTACTPAKSTTLSKATTARPGTPESCAERDRPRSGAAHRGGDRRRRLPADRHRRHAQCGLHLAARKRRSRSRHPHRDVDRRHCIDSIRPAALPGARKDARPRQDRLYLCARFELAVCDGRPQSGFLLPRRSTTPTRRISSCGTIAWSRSTTPPKSICRARPRRNPMGTAISAAPAGNCNSCAAPMPRDGGKSFICLASTYEKHGAAPEPDRPEPDPGQHRDHAAIRRDVRRHRIWDGQPQGQIGRGTGHGAHLHRPSRFPRGAGRQAYEHRLIPRGVSFLTTSR